MKQYLFKFTIHYLVLIVTLVNCSFVSVETAGANTDSKSTISLINPVKSRPGTKHVSFTNRLIRRLGFKVKKNNTGLIVLVVIIAVLLSLLLAFGIFIFAFGGASETLLAVTGIAGLGLIIFGAARIIRAIKRKQRTAYLKSKRNKIKEFSIDHPALL